MRLLKSLSPVILGMAVSLLLAGCAQVGIKQAVRARDITAVERILKEHPDQANARDANGDTILHYAVQVGDEQVVRTLLDSGADVKAKNAHDETPLDVATYQGSPQIMRTLLRGGARLVSPNALLSRAAAGGNVQVAEILLSHGADVNGGATPGSKDWSSPMHSAVTANMPDMVEFLVEHGGNVNVLNKAGQTPLHLAAESIYLQIARTLMDHGAKVNARMTDGQTPLHRAAVFGRTKMTEMLIGRGADANAVTKKGRTPFDVAAMEMKAETVQMLRAHGGKPSKRFELTDAVALGDKAAIARILAERPEAASEEYAGLTPLHFAAQHGLLTSVEALIAGKVDINIRNDVGQTPLHIAVRRAQRKIVEYLVTHGADIEARDKRQFSPISYLYHSGPSFRNTAPVPPTDERFRVIEQYLLKHGAKKE